MKLFIIILFAAPIGGEPSQAKWLGTAQTEATCRAMSRALIENEDHGAEIHCLPVGEAEWT